MRDPGVAVDAKVWGGGWPGSAGKSPPNTSLPRRPDSQTVNRAGVGARLRVAVGLNGTVIAPKAAESTRLGIEVIIVAAWARTG